MGSRLVVAAQAVVCVADMTTAAFTVDGAVGCSLDDLARVLAAQPGVVAVGDAARLPAGQRPASGAGPGRGDRPRPR